MRWPILISWLALSFFLAAGCDPSAEPSGQPTVTAELNVPFTLAPGQTAVLAEQNLSLTFEGVPEDGRCPVDVQCIAAGQAKTTVRASRTDGAATTLTLTVPALPEGVAYDSFRIHAEELLPVPLSTRTIRPGDYRLTLLVDRP